MTDADYMKIALELAQKGMGWVAPNPMVGAVIVKDGRIIGKGWHQKYGELHAERNALAECCESPEGAAIYVTLEPCCHYGKTPPCTDAIIESGISRVVVGSSDPNPLVAGKGLQILREHGIEVIKGILKEECDQLNAVFFHYITTKIPFVVMKYAMTLDGRICTYTGASKWITGEKSRAYVHKSRHQYSAIMVGVGTVLTDDPLLTCRMPNGKNPVRIICDTNLHTPVSSQIVKSARKIKTIIATADCSADPNVQADWEERTAPYRAAGCQLITVPIKDRHLDLNVLMKKLGESGIDSILLEGGGALNWSALESRIVKKVQCYVAPKIFGGAGAKSPVGGFGVAVPEDAFQLSNMTITQIGEDFLLEGEVEDTCLQE